MILLAFSINSGCVNLNTSIAFSNEDAKLPHSQGCNLLRKIFYLILSKSLIFIRNLLISLYFSLIK